MNTRGEIEIFAEGLDHPECIAFDRAGNLWAGGEDGQIYRIRADGLVETITQTRGGFILGLAFSPAGWLVVCDCRNHTLWRVDPLTGEIKIFATHAAGRALGHLNYAVFDRWGRCYVSDSGTWGRCNGTIYRFEPDGSGTVFAEGLNFANGLALDGTEENLYVVQSVAQDVLCVPIQADGSAGTPTIFVREVEHVPDGLAFDVLGNLYVSCYGGTSRIWRVAPSRRKRLIAEDPLATRLNRATNLAFGGPGGCSLYIANLGGWHIARMNLRTPGQKLAGLR